MYFSSLSQEHAYYFSGKIVSQISTSEERVTHHSFVRVFSLHFRTRLTGFFSSQFFFLSTSEESIKETVSIQYPGT